MNKETRIKYFEKAKGFVEHGVASTFGSDFWEYMKEKYFIAVGRPLCMSCSSDKSNAIKLFYHECVALMRNERAN